MRNKAEDQHNYLVEHHKEMLEKVLQQQIDAANRHEELRKQADERRKKLAAFRATMKNMTPEERRAYMDEHRADLFGPEPENRASARPSYPAPPALPPMGNPYLPQGSVQGPYRAQ